jgi:hypothetical protein
MKPALDYNIAAGASRRDTWSSFLPVLVPELEDLSCNNVIRVK